MIGLHEKLLWQLSCDSSFRTQYIFPERCGKIEKGIAGDNGLSIYGLSLVAITREMEHLEGRTKHGEPVPLSRGQRFKTFSSPAPLLVSKSMFSCTMPLRATGSLVSPAE